MNNEFHEISAKIAKLKQQKRVKDPRAVIRTVGDLKRVLEGIPDDTEVLGETNTERVIKIRGNLKYNWIGISVPVPDGPQNGW